MRTPLTLATLGLVSAAIPYSLLTALTQNPPTGGPPGLPPGFQVPGMGQPEGEREFQISSAGSAFPATNTQTASAAADAASRGGTMYVIDNSGPQCPEGTKHVGTIKSTQWVFYLEEGPNSKLVTNQRQRTASLEMRGRWQKFVPTSTFCDDPQVQPSGGQGSGGISLQIQTGLHMTSRNFMALNTTGRIWGPGFNDTVTPFTGGGTQAVGGSYSFEPKELAEMNKGSGIDLMEMMRRQTAAASGNTIDMTKPMMTAYLQSARMSAYPQVPGLIITMTASNQPEGVGLTIHDGKVFGGGAISDNEEENKGAVTYVNDDNDDGDQDFDNERSDREVAGEDEFTHVRVKIYPIRDRTTGDAGSIKIEMPAGRDSVKLWEEPGKGSPFDIRNPIKVKGPEFKMEGPAAYLDFYVEGTKPTGAQGVKFRLTYDKVPNDDDVVSLTVLQLEEISFEGMSNSINDDGQLDSDPNFGIPQRTAGQVQVTYNSLSTQAVRVFPGARLSRNSVESKPRNMVRVKAKLNATPPRPVTMHFRSFDVDDPTSDSAPLDPESRYRDNRGEATRGTQPHSGYMEGEKTGVLPLEFSRQEAEFKFETTMQPGDNFRIAGHADEDFLRNLKNDDDQIGGSGKTAAENRQRIYDKDVFEGSGRNATAAEIRDADKTCSPTLTVWRYMWVEVDKMGSIKENRVEGTISRIDANEPMPGQTTIKLSVNLGSIMGSRQGVQNMFENGRFTCQAASNRTVLSNTANWWAGDEIVVQGIVPEIAKGMDFILWDDDYTRREWDEGDTLPDMDTRNVDTRYAPAFVIPDFQKLDAVNQTKIVPFHRQPESGSPKDMRAHFVFDMVEHEANPNFWCAYLLGAFQTPTSIDGDPGTEFKTMAVGMVDQLDGQGVHIFYEILAEVHGSKKWRNVSPQGQWEEQDTIAHELCHLMGGRHGQGGIMDSGGALWFSDVSLDKMRQVKHP